MQVISIISLKGGVAKTTTTVNMAYALAAVHGKRVLVIDNDKQGNTSKAFDRYDTEDKDTIARVMLERNVEVSEIIKSTDYKNIDIITANMDLLEANLRTIVDTGRQQQTRFKKALSAAGEYDYCIIDNAPDINMSIINALVMSNDVIVPVLIWSFG
jgi:chromosome partitioning protein